MRKDHITNLETLHQYWNTIPDGTTADILASDLEAGNFDITHIVLPDGKEVEVNYTGPLLQGYISPFEGGTRGEDLDAN